MRIFGFPMSSQRRGMWNRAAQSIGEKLREQLEWKSKCMNLGNGDAAMRKEREQQYMLQPSSPIIGPSTEESIKLFDRHSSIYRIDILPYENEVTMNMCAMLRCYPLKHCRAAIHTSAFRVHM
jgi:hypothetical protein